MWVFPDTVDIPWDRQEEGTSQECRSAATDEDIIGGLYELFEYKNLLRRKAASQLELDKNNGFPTMPLEEMLKKAQEEHWTQGK